MKILILSFYYYPDLCAGSFRCAALVEQLRDVLGNACEIDVITTRPNRYCSYEARAPESEYLRGVRIQRITLPTHQSGMLDQTKAFAYFALQVQKIIKNQDYALVFATSSRLLTASLGAWVAQRKKAILYLDIRDIFVDTVRDVLPGKYVLLIKPLLSLLERWTISRAQRVNLVSPGFKNYFMQRHPAIIYRGFTNGIDPEFLMLDWCDCQREPNQPYTVLYAGNIGEGQGLHVIIPSLAKRMEGRVVFKIIGDGGRKTQLQAALKEAQCGNVELIPPMKRPELIKAYQNADVLFLHVNNYDAFLKVLPSKLFEYAAMGKPILAGISGFAAEFVKSELSQCEIFHPCDVQGAEDAFSRLEFSVAPRVEFIKKYQRSHIMKAMARDIRSLI